LTGDITANFLEHKKFQSFSKLLIKNLTNFFQESVVNRQTLLYEKFRIIGLNCLTIAFDSEHSNSIAHANSIAHTVYIQYSFIYIFTRDEEVGTGVEHDNHADQQVAAREQGAGRLPASVPVQPVLHQP
jgi:hypothetical protein